VQPDIDAVADTTEPAAIPQALPRPVRNIRRPLLGIGAVVAVIALGLLASRFRKQPSPPARVTPVANSSAPTAPAEGAPAPAAPESPATPVEAAHAVVVELRTVRPVWMRVVVDGRKNLEGMVQGGQSLRFAGDQSIVVRVGNGGDVLVKTGDREDPFGAAAQPLTRTFPKR
jgi:hypothetical protein